MSLGVSFTKDGTTFRPSRISFTDNMILNHHEPIISSETFNRAVDLRRKRSRNLAESYIPWTDRLTPYYQFVYSVENQKYLRYVLEKPKGKYEIPTLYCYNKNRSNRVMITIHNLFLLLNGAIQKTTGTVDNLSSTFTNTINHHLLQCEESLESATDKSDLLSLKLKLMRSKKSLPNYIKILRTTKQLTTVEDFRKLISKVSIINSNTIKIKLSLLDYLDTDIELTSSIIQLKIKSSLKDINYHVVI